MSSNVVTLRRYVPLERDDTIPWVTAIIQESSTPDPTSAWATIETLDLSPYDTDPANPASRDLTTVHAALDQGWYRVIWQDGSGNQSSPTAPVQNTSELAEGFRPSIREVAAHIRARTKILGGRELGTFTDQTRPTDDEVEDVIDDAVDEVMGKVQPVDYTLPFGQIMGPGSDYERRVRRAIALYAAISVELSFFPEQARTGQSPATIMQARYESRIRALIAEGETGRPEGEGAGGPGGGDAPADAAWSFPSAMPGALIGWSSRW